MARTLKTRGLKPRPQVLDIDALGERVRMADGVLKFAPAQAASDVYVGDERAHAQRISDFVCAQANRLRAMAREVPKVDPNLL